ncbi:MAG: LamB/YcsF family protein [Verrucomicrobiales bacterium]|nr:LamB/YcsF family protein [Verrucomicrobiales bacterium]
MKTIDLNCDVGEGAGNDAEIMPWVSSANVACGGHAGDVGTMVETMELARRSGVVVGAHPGFADREGFGRREQSLGDGEIVDLVAGQLGRLKEHGEFSYVKPHGALYTMAARDRRVADALVRAVVEFDRCLALMGLAGGVLLESGRAAGLVVVSEGFVDRRYDSGGGLVARGEVGAVIEGEREAVEQGVSMVLDGFVRSVGGRNVALDVDSICVHGDSAGAVVSVRRLKRELVAAGVEVKAFSG